MDRLSSCYFCGDALDASLDEYPVVPRELGPTSETQRTVVLCGTCRRKLDSVLEAVVEAASGGQTGESTVEPSLDDGEDVLRSVTDDGAGAEGTADGTGEGTGDGPDEDRTSGGGDGFEDSGFREGEAGDEDAGTDDVSGSPLDASGAADGSSEESTATAGDADDSRGETDEPSGKPAETTLTKLEYNKVMRLLQNREFPVERDGFVTVAANAYELSHRECEEVIDVAIQHGLIDEADGKLVKPDDGDS